MYLGEGEPLPARSRQALDDGVAAGVLPSRPVIVNLQNDIDHPTQAMADFLHLAHHFGGWTG
jgi:ornithine carbamoyltransferase